MYNNWNVDLKDSVKALYKIKDTVLPKIINGKIYCIEDKEDEVLMMLDRLSGIDYIRKDNNGLQGIAARVQWGNNWDTFTIRSKRKNGKETELSKRINQIENGYFYPNFTLQAYFDNRINNNLLSVAIVKTKDLYNLYLSDPSIFKKSKSDNNFIYIEWYELIKNNVQVKVYYN